MNSTYFAVRSQIVLLVLCVVLSSTASWTLGQERNLIGPDRKDFVSDASFIVGAFRIPKDIERTPDAMTTAAKAFVDSLSDEQKSICLHDLQSKERRLWTNLPAPADAGGIRFAVMSKVQAELACKMLATMMSEHGYKKMRDIMLADDQLLRNGKPRRGFGTENFAIVIFGTPSATKPWAVQLDGHHVGVNLAIEGEKLSMSPSFIGTQPHMFKIGRKRFKPFASETDLAHDLMASLTDEQIKAAVLDNERGKIKVGPGNDGKTIKAEGVEVSTFSARQTTMLEQLISQWVNDLPDPQATKRMEEIKSEFDQMKFSWNGNKEPGSDVSYRIQSPSLIIEYACQDLGGNPIDHLHSMYRNPKNEYGLQLESEN